MDKIKRYREIQNKYGDDLSKMPPEILEEYKTLQTDIRNNYTPIELGETVSAKTTEKENTADILNMMAENIKKNKGDIFANKMLNDVMSLGELHHNINEPEFSGTGVREPYLTIGQRISAKPIIDKLETSKNATIKQLQAIGRQDLIPAVMKAAETQISEAITNANNINANFAQQTEQLNTQALNQGIQLGLSNEQFNAQMREQKETMKGAAISENLTNIRASTKDYLNSMTANRDNEVSMAMYLSALEDPEVQKAFANFMKNRSKRAYKDNLMDITKN